MELDLPANPVEKVPPAPEGVPQRSSTTSQAPQAPRRRLLVPGYSRPVDRLDVNWWLQELRAGEEFRRQNAMVGSWDVWREQSRGLWDSRTYPVNLFHLARQTVMLQTYFRDPALSVTARKPGEMNALLALVMQRIDNKLVKAMRLKQALRRAVMVAFDKGTAFGKLGFGTQYMPVAGMGENKAPQVRGYTPEYRTGVIGDLPWFQCIDPRYVVLPEGTEDYEGAPWVAHQVLRPIEDVRNDPRFENTALLQPRRLGKPGLGSKEPRRPYQTSVDFASLYEIRDKRTQQVFVISPGVDEPILPPMLDEYQAAFGLPIYPLVFNTDTEQPWGTPDAVYLDPIQDQMNKVATSMTWHAIISVFKIMYEKGALDEESMNAIANGDMGGLVGVNPGFWEKVKSTQIASIPPELFKMHEVLWEHFREIIGVGRNQLGESLKAGSADVTATEAQIVQAASQIRVDGRRDLMADMIVQIFEDVHQLLFTHWNADQVIDMVGPQGQVVWVAVPTSLLRDTRYELEADPDSSAPQTRALRAKRATDLFGLFSGNPMLQTLLDPIKITKYLLRELGTPDFDDMMRMLPRTQSGPGAPDQPMSPQAFLGMNAGDPMGMRNNLASALQLMKTMKSGGQASPPANGGGPPAA